MLESPNVRGILLAVINGLLLAIASAIGKQVTQELPPFEVAFLRSVFMFVFMVPWLMRVGFSQLRTSRIDLHLTRAVISSVAILLWFWALQTVPLADIAALEFLSPLWVLAGAILFLGEKSRLWRWAALGVGFAGTMVILRPGFVEISLGAMAVIL
ncbi:MAG: DMT family transporter, partial [Rhodospirillales bacterium]|nr:DMT family transporter [Rhodospirillales bacterium]